MWVGSGKVQLSTHKSKSQSNLRILLALSANYLELEQTSSTAPEPKSLSEMTSFGGALNLVFPAQSQSSHP